MASVAVEEEVESEDEEQEPKFKYKRILNDITKIFQGDAASCIAIHDKFLALGTQWGRIYVLDHLGNMLPNKVVVAHQVSVNAVSIERSGDYLASCSNDGKVFIYGLSATDYNQVVNMERPIRSVALEPGFSKQSSGQQFVTADRVLVLHERGFFTRDKQQIVYAGEERDGFISVISWEGPFIAFANDTGVRVYDRDLKRLITQICAVRDNLASSSDPSVLSKRVEVCYIWELKKHFVAGLSFRIGETGIGKQIDWKEIVVLALCRRDLDGSISSDVNCTHPQLILRRAAVKKRLRR